MVSYFEKLTLLSLPPGLFDVLRGRPVYYFDVGRALPNLPVIGKRLLRLFKQTEYEVSEMPGMSYAINSAALEAAEELQALIAERNALALRLWYKAFPSDRIHLYIKKMIASEAWTLIRDYLILREWLRNDHSNIQLRVQDSALNRELVLFLRKNYPEPGIRITGIGRTPWRQVHQATKTVGDAFRFYLRLLASFKERGFSLHSKKRRFKLSKEILWGIGTPMQH